MQVAPFLIKPLKHSHLKLPGVLMHRYWQLWTPEAHSSRSTAKDREENLLNSFNLLIKSGKRIGQVEMLMTTIRIIVRGRLHGVFFNPGVELSSVNGLKFQSRLRYKTLFKSNARLNGKIFNPELSLTAWTCWAEIWAPGLNSVQGWKFCHVIAHLI